MLCKQRVRQHVSGNSVQCHNLSVPGDFGMLLIIRRSNLSLIPFQVLCTFPTAFCHCVKTFDSKELQLCHAAKSYSCVMQKRVTAVSCSKELQLCHAAKSYSCVMQKRVTAVSCSKELQLCHAANSYSCVMQQRVAAVSCSKELQLCHAAKSYSCVMQQRITAVSCSKELQLCHAAKSYSWVMQQRVTAGSCSKELQLCHAVALGFQVRNGQLDPLDEAGMNVMCRILMESQEFMRQLKVMQPCGVTQRCNTTLCSRSALILYCFLVYSSFCSFCLFQSAGNS